MFWKRKEKIKCFEKSMLKRPGSPRKRDNTVDFLKIKTYKTKIGYVCKKAYNFLRWESLTIKSQG